MRACEAAPAAGAAEGKGGRAAVASAAAATEPRGILHDVVESIFEPGVNRGVMICLHAAFLALLGSIIYLIVLSGGHNVHLFILLGIAAFLYVAIIWFIHEMMCALRANASWTPPAGGEAAAEESEALASASPPLGEAGACSTEALLAPGGAFKKNN